MTWIEDGYIVGALSSHLKACPVCEARKQRVIDVATFTGHSFGVEATILYNRKAEVMYSGIGLSCGCYARLHRQIGHINHSMSRAGNLVGAR